MFGLVPFNRRQSDLASRYSLFDIGRFFDEFFNDPFTSGFFASATPIKADIRENDKEYIIEADLPGVRKEDIRLEYRDGVLMIGVEQNEQVNEERENYIRRERRYGSYCRSFHVDGVKEDGITAKYNNGVLTVKLPKSDDVRVKTHKIDIN